MRLGLDLLFLIPGETGGRETYARELIAALIAEQPELDAVAFVGADATPALRADLATAMRMIRVPSTARRPDRWAAGELVQLPVAAHRAGVDVLHSLANFGPVAGPFRRVLTLHDMQYRAVPELLTTARRAGTTVMLETAARRAHRIITVSGFSRDEIVRELGIEAGRIDVVPNGLGSSAVNPTSEAALRERLDLGARSVVLTAASDLPHKNLGVLVDALALLPADQRPLLVIAGAGTDRGDLPGRVAGHRLSHDVRLLGFCPAPDLEGLYAMAGAFVLPSVYEGFGMPVLEAMSRGVPVICADIPALREVGGDAAAYFAPNSPAEIAAAITLLTSDNGLATRLAGRGRDRARGFSWHAAAIATMACYRRAYGKNDQTDR